MMNSGNGNSKISQWQSQALGLNPTLQSQSQSQQQLQNSAGLQDQSSNQPQLQPPGSGINGSSPLANYTLPGVISYLTSEFTNLERFKIMTNLEKSEMKYRITHLQGEINSLKLINEQQKLKIQQLETENKHLREEHKLPQDQTDVVLPEIPEIDLLLIKDSRLQLTKSMKEVIHLLRSPTNVNLDYLELPNPHDTSISFDELLQNDEMMFAGYNKSDGSKSKRSAVNQYFNNDEGYINDDSIGEKFNNLSLSENDDKNLESDVETVILDGQTDLKDEGEMEPDPDISDNSDSYLNADIPPFKISEIQLIDEEYNNVRVFSNPMSSEILYIYHDNKNSEDLIKVALYDIIDNRQIVEMNAKLHLFNDIENILDLYCLSFDEEDQKLRLLAVNKENSINEIILCGEDSFSSLVVSVPSQQITSSSLIRFDRKLNPRSKAYGLAISLLSSSSTVINIYEVTIGPRDSIENKELGSYDPAFFTSKESSDVPTEFTALKWFVKDGQPKPTIKKKANKGSSINENPELSPYNLLIKLNNSIYLFNIILNQFDQITDYSTSFNSKLEGFNSGFTIANGSQLTVFDLKENSDDNYTRFDLSSPSPTAIFTSIPYANKFALIEVDQGHLKLYDETFNLIKSYEVQFDNIFRVGNSIVIQQNSNLKVYILN